jgi:hypothetical protein
MPNSRCPASSRIALGGAPRIARCEQDVYAILRQLRSARRAQHAVLHHLSQSTAGRRPGTAQGAGIGSQSTKRSTRLKLVHQFLIVLTGTDPLVWRRLQVPERYSFWDLHVAIQDAMRWLDCHLHEFRLFDRTPQSLGRRSTRSWRLGTNRAEACVVSRNPTLFKTRAGSHDDRPTAVST